MNWERVEREAVRLGDTIRIVVPEVMAIAEGADGRPAFGYDQTAVFVERLDPDIVEADLVGAALAGAGIGDLRRGIPLEDWKAEAGPDGIRISGRLPEGVSLDGDMSQYSVLHSGRDTGGVDRGLYEFGRVLRPDQLVPAGTSVTTSQGDLPRCPAVDIDEGVCVYAPHSDRVPHAFTMSALSPQIAEEPTS